MRGIALHAILMLFGPLIASPAALAGERALLAAAELHTGVVPTELVDNSAFLPTDTARAARHALSGVLRVEESAMGTAPARLSVSRLFGQDIARFPAFELGFFSDGDDLVPVSQELVLAGSTASGGSYWDLLVQPGRVWSEPGDGDWSRAAFPFALVRALEGETHNGVASFLFNGEAVTGLRFQLSWQTAPFLVQDRFVAWGRAPARFAPAEFPNGETLRAAHRAQVARRLPVRGWEELEQRVGAERLRGFEGSAPAGDVLVNGLVHEGALYLQPCATAAGPLPFCDRQRFGIWSVTKSASAALALLRMAQKFGPSILEERILDHVPIAAGHAGWAKVRLRDALDMATGVGFGSARRDPADSGDGYLDGNYAAWYEAASLEGKLRELAKAPDLPWGPGEVMRYRDQDTFLLGVAMDRLLKTRSGVAADVWGLLEEEVYGPIGIASAPTNRTLEADGGEGQPLMAYGFYPTLEDLARIAALLHAHGRHGGVQILHPELTAEVLAGARPRGLPTGAVRGGVAQRYFRSFWYSRFEAGGCGLYVPEMQGWGGNIVALMPGGLTGIRIAGAIGDTRAVDDTTGMMRAGHALAPFCAEP